MNEYDLTAAGFYGGAVAPTAYAVRPASFHKTGDGRF